MKKLLNNVLFGTDASYPTDLWPQTTTGVPTISGILWDPYKTITPTDPKLEKIQIQIDELKADIKKILEMLGYYSVGNTSAIRYKGYLLVEVNGSYSIYDLSSNKIDEYFDSLDSCKTFIDEIC